VSSYQVFARKYRPQTFDFVVGQEHITQTLKNAIASNRLAHAYLFVGPRGTGKTSTARILAKALNCVHGPTVNPCGECDVCREIAAGNSLDVLEIDGASNNGVEQVRELRENVRFAPTRGKYKVYIIDEVHMLTTAAFNALLKTLEEPPEHVKFIFATTDVQKVLPTILSRCQRFDLRRIPSELIAGHLGYIARQEGIDLAPDAARTIAKGAEGGLRDAESMLDQLVAFCGEKITEEDVLSVFGFTASQTVSSLCDALLEEDSSSALAVVQQQAEAGRDLSRLMADLIGHLRNLLVAKADPEGIKTEVGEEELSILQEQAARVDLDRLLDLIEQFAAAEGRMKWAPNKKLHFEIAVIKAIQTLGQATLTEILDTLTAIRTGGELPAAAVKRERPSRPERPPLREAAARPTPKPLPVTVPEAKAAAPAPAAPAITTVPALEKAESSPQPAAPAPVAEPEPAPQPAPVQSEPSSLKREKKKEDPLSALSETGSDSLPPWDERVPASLPPQPKPEPEAAPRMESLPMFDSLAFAPEPKREPTPPIPEPEPLPEEPVAFPEPAPESAEPTEPAFEATSTNGSVATPEHNGDLHNVWSQVVTEVRAKKPLLRAWAEAGTLASLAGGVAVIAFPEDQAFAMESLSKPITRKFLQETITRFAGQPVELKFEKRAGLQVAPVELPETSVQAPADPMAEFKNDPLIKRALELFQAEIQQS